MCNLFSRWVLGWLFLFVLLLQGLCLLPAMKKNLTTFMMLL